MPQVAQFTTKHLFYLKGLSCASCSDKIEQEVKKLAGVTEATLDFANSKLFVESTDEEPEQLREIIEQIAQSAESQIRVREVNSDEATTPWRTAANITLVLSLITFFAGIILPYELGKISLLLISYLLAGFPVLRKAAQNIRQGQIFDENFLMSVATIGAVAIQEFPEAAAVMIFYRSGEFLQSLAVDRSRRSISQLIAIRPDRAHLQTENGLQTVPVENVQVDDIVVVKSGERIPVDGLVIEGFSTLDTSALTGESLPRDIEVGDEALAGCINLSGLLTIKTTKVAAESSVARILDLVENAATHKAPTEDFITKFARYYTPVVVGIAILIAVIPPLVISGALFSDWLYRALVFLVVSCPCALVVSIPLGFFGGIGSASRQGVLVKGSNYLQALHEVDTIVFDKTGTLTSGDFQVTEIKPATDIDENKLWQLAAHAESVSNHPIARSIVKAYPGEIDANLLANFTEHAGLGISATVDDKEILVGSARFLETMGIIGIMSQAQQGVYVAVNGKYGGFIAVADTPKSDAKSTIKHLKEIGIKRITMLTGDRSLAAQGTAQELGVTDVRAELLPEDKLTELEKIIDSHQGKGRVAFVGDGINDAPALARADVGIAMGALGSDAAIEVADVVIMTDEPSRVADAIGIANHTNSIVWQNIILALGVKIIVLALGAFGLATLWQAVFADVGVTLLAVLNSVRRIPQKNVHNNRI